MVLGALTRNLLASLVVVSLALQGVDAAGLLYDTGHRPPCCMQKGQGVA